LNVLVKVAFSQQAPFWVVEVAVVVPLWGMGIFLLFNLYVLDGVTFYLGFEKSSH
jgi:hypothetical protein